MSTEHPEGSCMPPARNIDELTRELWKKARTVIADTNRRIEECADLIFYLACDEHRHRGMTSADRLRAIEAEAATLLGLLGK